MIAKLVRMLRNRTARSRDMCDPRAAAEECVVCMYTTRELQSALVSCAVCRGRCCVACIERWHARATSSLCPLCKSTLLPSTPLPLSRAVERKLHISPCTLPFGVSGSDAGGAPSATSRPSSPMTPPPLREQVRGGFAPSGDASPPSEHPPPSPLHAGITLAPLSAAERAATKRIAGDATSAGVRVKHVMKGDAADVAGIRRNDILTHINGLPCRGHEQAVCMLDVARRTRTDAVCHVRSAAVRRAMREQKTPMPVGPRSRRAAASPRSASTSTSRRTSQTVVPFFATAWGERIWRCAPTAASWGRMFRSRSQRTTREAMVTAAPLTSGDEIDDEGGRDPRATDEPPTTPSSEEELLDDDGNPRVSHSTRS